ncbi:helix-turn-helix domain-containing protein [Treponema ruminis]|uniref:Transcriptional regulator with XRE-family HTH domain n=1 Tax=Treponema ruminis TaxID=744515 RepID=A0A7W8LMK4_9SPIR|nr:helix-turn-helix domain-containing protein [Treponema ruminis]MBB5226624.1 transcriptional regulator with XRE-family HTH domain [Treponema ruminis]QSI02147.1 helix-turn-helix domain-containing protein [Treponema ruminis]
MINQYITGAMIKRLREEKGLTQTELAEKIFVTDKAVSKWETGRGYPDISLVESLAKALGVSVIELLSGENITNKNKAANMSKAEFYVCPVCGNVIQSSGEAVVSCCGITLPPLEAEDADENHAVKIERVEDEYFVFIDHEMTKQHYISFIAAIRSDGIEIKKLYPEQNAQVRFKISGTKQIYFYCNRHGLFKKR